MYKEIKKFYPQRFTKKELNVYANLRYNDVKKLADKNGDVVVVVYGYETKPVKAKEVLEKGELKKVISKVGGKKQKLLGFNFELK
jgi:ribosomal protein L25 (general stress protein Ctc)